MDILHEVEVATTPHRLYEALTTQKGLASWYTPEVRAVHEVGAIIQLKFAHLTTLTFRIAKLVAERHVAWAGVQVPGEWKHAPITFDIRPLDDESTRLTFRQRGFAPDYARLSFAVWNPATADDDVTSRPFAGSLYLWRVRPLAGRFRA